MISQSPLILWSHPTVYPVGLKVVDPEKGPNFSLSLKEYVVYSEYRVRTRQMYPAYGASMCSVRPVVLRQGMTRTRDESVVSASLGIVSSLCSMCPFELCLIWLLHHDRPFKVRAYSLMVTGQKDLNVARPLTAILQ